MQSWIHVIEWRANTRPELTALVDDRGAAYTYAQLKAATERRAGRLGRTSGSGPATSWRWWPRTAPTSWCTRSR